MSEEISRHIQIDNWVFEVKMVRALRVQSYGEPYSAIANINLNGSSAYVDGMMQKNLQPISQNDLNIIEQYCQQMSISDINFDINNQLQSAQKLNNSNTLVKLA